MDKLFDKVRYLSLASFVVLLFLNVFNLVREDLAVLQRSHPDVTLTSSALTFAVRSTRDVLKPQRLVAQFELVSLMCYAWCIAVDVYKITTFRKTDDPKKGYKHWFTVGKLCMQTLPELQSYSAMRVLTRVAPPVIQPELQQLMFETKGKRWSQKLPRFAFFVCRKLLFLFVGFKAFVVKFAQAAAYLPTADEKLWSLIQILLFANQMLGIISINIFMRERLFRFVFGGVDGLFSEQEHKRKGVWIAAMHCKAWRAYSSQPLQFFSVVLTFNDMDFEKMVLDD